MPNPTPNLGLKKPLGNEVFNRQAYNENLDLMDQNAAKKMDLNAHLAEDATEGVHGMGSAANKNVQTSLSDTTAERLMHVGAFGWGRLANLNYPKPSYDTPDCPTGTYRVGGAVGTPPPGAPADFTITVLGRYNIADVYQIALWGISGGFKMYGRRLVDTTVGPWCEIFNSSSGDFTLSGTIEGKDIKGRVTHKESYLDIKPHGASHDDGSFVRCHYSGTQGQRFNWSGRDANNNTIPVELFMTKGLVTQAVLKNYFESLVNYTSWTGTQTLNVDNGNVFKVSQGAGNLTLNFATPDIIDQAASFTLLLKMDATQRTISWPASVVWSDGAPPPAPLPGKMGIYTFLTLSGGTRWYGFLSGVNITE